MDDLLAKPFVLEQLQQILKRWTPNAGRTPRASTAPLSSVEKSSCSGDAISMETLETLRDIGSRVGKDLVTTVLRNFLATADENIRRLERAVRERDAQSLSRAAHGLASSTANIGAHALSAHYRQLEQVARGSHLDQAATALADLKREQFRVVARIEEILAAAA
jgi:HPt (histidine-containing phosphotransfer) domain-containing protein